MMRVKNMISANSGREVANQFIIENGNKTLFQSYDSPIVEINRGKNVITIFESYDCSRTTGKYRNQFMRSQGFRGMDSLKGFSHYMELGAIGRFEIKKAF